MLTLKRRPGDRVFLTLATGEVIAVVVTELKESSVMLSIDAPRTVSIEREEVRRARDKRRNQRET